MTSARWSSLILLFVLVCLPNSHAFAGMVLLAGAYGSIVYDTDGAEDDRFNDVTPGVQFERTTSANYKMLTADGSFNTYFDTNLLTSSFESTHSLLQTTQEPINELFSETGSTFWFSTDMDVEVSVHGSMSFDLGVHDSGTGAVFEILDENQDRIYQNILGNAMGTGAGMFYFDDSIVLEGGGMYFVQLYSNLVTFAHRLPGPGSTASSEINLVIATVPEPASLVLLCCGSMIACRRWRRRV